MKKLTSIFPAPTQRKRVLFFFLLDVVIISVSLYASFFVRFAYQWNYEFLTARRYLVMITHALPLFLFIKLSVFAFFRMYRITWRYVGIHDLVKIARAVLFAQIILIFIILLLFDIKPFNLLHITSFRGFPRSIFIIDGLISFFLLAGLRVSKRVWLEIIGRSPRKRGLNTIIVGAGNIGETVVRDMIRQKFANYYPVAFLDDDKDKIGSHIHGVPVTGVTGALQATVLKLKAEAVIIAIPSLNYKKLRELYHAAQQSKVKVVKIVPSMYIQQKPQINIKELQDITIEDVVGRQNVSVDYGQIGQFLKGKVVLITGAGGSIGSEIVMQVFSLNPGKIILLDSDETELFNMELKLKQQYNRLSAKGDSDDSSGFLGKYSFVVADIRDKNRINRVFKEYRPDIVFHSAAYKHVPMMECNAEEAVKVNVFGTYNLAEAAEKWGAEKFIMISTDKAVKPTSVMGATKRISENICKAFNNRRKLQNTDNDDIKTGETAFVSVRFGNVLGSRGSILPLFLQQLQQGGPITVTHKEMQRYFMTIPEAVALVLQASVIGKGGEVMVLDMGEPVKITKLAEELISLHGLRPHEDIKIEYTGIRAGENLFEEILTKDETATIHEKVFVSGNLRYVSMEEIDKILLSLTKTINDSETGNEKIKEILSLHC